MKKLSDCTVLIVDDTEANVDILVNAVGETYDVSVAMNGQAALEAAAENPPDLILLDVMMPGMDGYEVCRQLRKIEKTSEIPVIFLTARNEKKDIVKGFEAGAQDYITKPFYIREVMERVRTQLALKCQKEALGTMNLLLEKTVDKRTLELEEASRKLEIANRELTTLDDAKNRFLELISHEIRTPLNGILGVTDLLKEMLGEEPELAEFLDMLQISADRLEAFSSTALTITQLQIKHRQISQSKLSAILCLEEIFQEFQEKAAKKSVALEMVVADESLDMDADQELIHRVLRSILDNAIRYSPESSDVICTISMEEGTLVFEVVDQGKGFSEDALKNLFKPFGLGEPHYDLNVGLSLLEAKLIMDAHRGSIEAFNKENGGTAVRLVFPSVYPNPDKREKCLK